MIGLKPKVPLTCKGYAGHAWSIRTIPHLSSVYWCPRCDAVHEVMASLPPLDVAQALTGYEPPVLTERA